MKKYLLPFLIGLGLAGGFTVFAAFHGIFVNGGGTGVGAVSNGSLLYGSSTNVSLNVLATGTPGYVLTMSGNVPTWQPATGGVGGSGVPSTTPFTNGYVPYATSTLALTNSPLFIQGNNVAIGTTTAQEKLWVHLATNVNLAARLSGSAAAIVSANDADSLYAPLQLDASSIAMQTLSGYNVGIGVGSPNYKLEVAGTASTTALDVVGNINDATLTASSLIKADANDNLSSYVASSNCSSGQVEYGLSAAGVPVCGTNGMQTALTLPLSVNNGGTGVPWLTAGDILFGNGASAVATSSTLTYNSTTNNLFVTNASTTNFTVGTGELNQGTLTVQGQTSLTNASTTVGTFGTLYNIAGQTYLFNASTTVETDGILFVTGQTNLKLVSSTGLSSSGILNVTGSSTLAGLSATNIFDLGATSCTNLQTASSGLISCNSTTYLTTTNVSGTTGQQAYFTAANTVTSGSTFLNNGSVFGMNATSSTIGFNIQGTAGTNTILNVASSSTISIFAITPNQRVGIGETAPTASLAIEATSTYPTIDLLDLASSTGSIVLSVNANVSGTYNLIQAGTSTAGNLFVVDSLGSVYVNHLVGSTTIPSIATSTGVGAISGYAVLGTGSTDVGGFLHILTQNAPAANVTAVTLTFARTYTGSPFCVWSSATSAPASIMNIWSTTTASTLLFKVGATALTATSTYDLYYQCNGQLGG